MRAVIHALVACVLFLPTARSDKLAPSSALKAYKGPEGQLVVMVEISDGKEMLVHFRNLDKDLDGKTLRYQLESHGSSKTVFIPKKRGSKTYRSIMLTALDNQWDFYHPVKLGTHFAIRYSESASATIKVDDVVNAYRP
jgi:hypothetical protein